MLLSIARATISDTMPFGFRSCFGLVIALFACPACEWVLGDIPDNASLEPGTDGGSDSSAPGAATSSTGSAGANASGTSSGAGGSNVTGNGAGGRVSGSVGGNAGSLAAGGQGASAGASGGAGDAGGNGGSAGSAGMGGKAGAGGTAGAAGVAGSGQPDASSPRDSAVDADPCDMDGDGFRSRACSGGNDCDDNAKLVYPNEPNFYEDPTHVGGTDFDYDCDGIPRPQYASINCAGLGLTCNQTASAFLGTTAPACGQSGRFGHCVVSGLSCIEQVEQAVKKMPCK